MYLSSTLFFHLENAQQIILVFHFVEIICWFLMQKAMKQYNQINICIKFVKFISPRDILKDDKSP